MNYFHYFSEIEERFQKRRGSILMLSTLDWALIETWREAGIPLEAVLRGIDDAFDKHDAKLAVSKTRTRKVNGLAWCAQAVMQATEEMQEAATGMQRAEAREPQESGFEAERVAAFLEQNAAAIDAATNAGAPHLASEMWVSTATTTAMRLRELSAAMRENPIPLDDLDRTLTVLEEKLFSAIFNATPEDELVSLRAQADRELAPYRAKMSTVQLRQIQQQFLHKRLMQSRNLPRLSLFYMGHA
ncbi:MAG TPA: hypothetical protein VFC39_02195 [Acidobacteriaceae bacterium]|nr:hypothetical protein [Acidobacteriaceae bacterium]